MFKHKKFSVAVFSFFILTLWVVSGAWGIGAQAIQLNPEDLESCAAACRVAKYVTPADERLRPEHGDCWKGERWTSHYEEKDVDPTVSALVFRRSIAEKFLGEKKTFFGAFIAKGTEITIAFSGTDLLNNLKNWQEKNDTIVLLSEGVGHWGSLQLWQAVRGELLGKGGKIRRYMGSFIARAKKRGLEPLTSKGFQIRVVGHSLGGMVAQWAAMDILKHIYGGDNEENRVIVVTMGAPRVFNAEGARLWDEKMKRENHLRLVGQQDVYLDKNSGQPFNAFTGVERDLEQKKFGVGIRDAATSGKFHHRLKAYEKLLRDGKLLEPKKEGDEGGAAAAGCFSFGRERGLIEPPAERVGAIVKFVAGDSSDDEEWFLRGRGLERKSMTLKRGLVACCIAQCVENGNRPEEKHTKYWKGDNWDAALLGGQGTEPTIETLKFEGENVQEFLGDNHGCSGVLAAKGKQIIIAFSEEDSPGEPRGWKKGNDRVADLLTMPHKSDRFRYRGFTRKQGYAHWGSLELWKAVSNTLLGKEKTGTFGEGLVKQHMDKVNAMLVDAGHAVLAPQDFHFEVFGYGLGGVLAQLGGLDIVNRIHEGNNKGGNVEVITVGTPSAFDVEAARRWDKMMGGPDKHLRFVVEQDVFSERSSAAQLNAFTGTRKVLTQEGGDGVWTDKKFAFQLRDYKGLFEERVESRKEAQEANLEEFLDEVEGEVPF